MAEMPTTLQTSTAVPPAGIGLVEREAPRSLPMAQGFDYDSDRRRHSFFDEIYSLIKYRQLVVQLVSRNIKTRYKRSVLGVAWTMISPLMMMTILTIVFSSIFKTSVEHYAVFLLTAFTLWGYFSQTSAGIMTELTWGGSLLSKIYVPPSVFAVSALGTGLVNLVLSLVPLLIIMLVTGVPLTWSLLYVPVSLLFTTMFALGLGLMLSRLAIFFGDVVEMYQIIIMVWFYASPIIYPIESIPEGRRFIFQLNPMYYLIETFREPIYAGHLPDPYVTLFAGLFSFGTLIFGWWFFTQKVDEFAYRV